MPNPTPLHPAAWWLWAVGVAAGASRTTNPLALALLAGACCLVVVVCREDAPWALGLRLYLVMAGMVVVIRTGFRVLLGGGSGTVLWNLPAWQMPEALGGFRLLGPVTAEALAGGFSDGLRLATLILAVGAANCLANPKRLLAALPAGLYQFGTVVVIGLNQFPQLAESAQRIARARQLRRAEPGRWQVLRRVVTPLLTEAMDRALALAAAMDAHGYGRRGAMRSPKLVAGATIGGALAVCAGLYAGLDTSAASSPWLWLACGLGVGLALAGLAIAGRQSARTRFQPDRWGKPEWLVVAVGAGCAIVLTVVANLEPALAYPEPGQLWPPAIAPAGLLGPLLALAPVTLTLAPAANQPALPASGMELAEQQAPGRLNLVAGRSPAPVAGTGGGA